MRPRISTPPASAAGNGTKAGVTQLIKTAVLSQLRRYPAHIAQSLDMRVRAAAREIAGDGPQISAIPEEARLAATWLGHATVLMRVGNTTILTDPVLSGRIGPKLAGRTVGVPRRHAAPPPLLPDKPLDIVLISHAHFDHLDRPTLKRLVNPQTVVITAKGTRRLIPRGFARVIELDWHESVDVKRVSFTAYRPRHWGARAVWDRHRGYNSYVMETKRERVLFGGDTAFTDAFDGMTAKLAIFGIGAYEPWEHAHATPEQVWRMFSAMQAGHLLPMHHSTFALGDEGPDEPMQRLIAAAGGEADRVVGRRVGEVWVAPES
jgi:L-ascorbate metabolism protein UlaG (beta-lactamase superfamily)